MAVVIKPSIIKLASPWHRFIAGSPLVRIEDRGTWVEGRRALRFQPAQAFMPAFLLDATRLGGAEVGRPRPRGAARCPGLRKVDKNIETHVVAS